MALSVYLKDKLLSNTFQGGSFTPPTTTYVALLSTSPTDDSGTALVELTTSNWTGYTRTSVADSGWNNAAGGTTSAQSISNTATITPAGTASANLTITGFALYDAATAGNFLGWGSIASGAVTSGTGVSFAPAALQIEFS